LIALYFEEQEVGIMMSEQQNLPQVALGLGDVRAMVSVIKGYLPTLQRMAGKSFVRRQEWYCLQSLQHRLEQIGAQGGALTLTVEELDALDHALTGFSLLVRQQIRQSVRRDEVLAGVEGIRGRLRAMRG
jgi:hypothetical protein